MLNQGAVLRKRDASLPPVWWAAVDTAETTGRQVAADLRARRTSGQDPNGPREATSAHSESLEGTGVGRNAHNRDARPAGTRLVPPAVLCGRGPRDRCLRLLVPCLVLGPRTYAGLVPPEHLIRTAHVLDRSRQPPQICRGVEPDAIVAESTVVSVPELRYKLEAADFERLVLHVARRGSDA